MQINITSFRHGSSVLGLPALDTHDIDVETLADGTRKLGLFLVRF